MAVIRTLTLTHLTTRTRPTKNTHVEHVLAPDAEMHRYRHVPLGLGTQMQAMRASNLTCAVKSVVRQRSLCFNDTSSAPGLNEFLVKSA